MNPFVEECRREWKRLGVPDAVANEMAADLEVDLAEAEAEGTSAEEVLGTGVFDAPAFAAAWAAERGVIPPPAPSEPTRARRSRAPYVIAGFVLVALDRPGAGAPAAADRLGALALGASAQRAGRAVDHQAQDADRRAGTPDDHRVAAAPDRRRLRGRSPRPTTSSPACGSSASCC